MRHLHFGTFGILSLLILVLGLVAQERPRPIPAQAPVEPDDQTLYVWAVPEKGFQSVLILEMIDNQTFDAAYLVPVRMKLPKAGNKDELDKILPGKLHVVSIQGRSGAALTVDIWQGKQKGWWSKPKP